MAEKFEITINGEKLIVGVNASHEISKLISGDESLLINYPRKVQGTKSTKGTPKIELGGKLWKLGYHFQTASEKALYRQWKEEHPTGCSGKTLATGDLTLNKKKLEEAKGLLAELEKLEEAKGLPNKKFVEGLKAEAQARVDELTEKVSKLAAKEEAQNNLLVSYLVARGKTLEEAKELLGL